MRYNISYSQKSDDDIKEIFEYINKDNPERALLYIEEMQNHIDRSLSVFPEKYRKYRSCYIFPYKNYLVIFDIDKSNNIVNILSIASAFQYTKYRDHMY